MSLIRAFLWNVGTLYMMVRENFISGESMKEESIDACMRGGSSCTSVEVFVMKMERRGCVSSMRSGVN